MDMSARVSDVESDPLFSELWFNSEARGNAQWLAGQTSVVGEQGGSMTRGQWPMAVVSPSRRLRVSAWSRRGK